MTQCCLTLEAEATIRKGLHYTHMDTHNTITLKQDISLYYKVIRFMAVQNTKVHPRDGSYYCLVNFSVTNTMKAHPKEHQVPIPPTH